MFYTSHRPGLSRRNYDSSELANQIEFALKRYPDRRAEFDGLAVARVWRQGDDGNQMRVGTLTSERAAKCRIAELESHKHKQTYWYTTR